MPKWIRGISPGVPTSASDGDCRIQSQWITPIHGIVAAVAEEIHFGAAEGFGGGAAGGEKRFLPRGQFFAFGLQAHRVGLDEAADVQGDGFGGGNLGVGL